MFQYLAGCLQGDIPIAHGSDASAVPTAAIYESTGISDYELFDIDLFWIGRRHRLSTTNAHAHCDKNNGFSHAAILLEPAEERGYVFVVMHPDGRILCTARKNRHRPADRAQVGNPRNKKADPQR
jgi:hypothetical protein